MKKTPLRRNRRMRRRSIKAEASVDLAAEFRDQVLKRDRHCCRVCIAERMGLISTDKPISELRNQLMVIDVHHIDGDKSNNDIRNLIAIKHSTHAAINGKIGGMKSRRILTPEQARAMVLAREARKHAQQISSEQSSSNVG